MNKSATPNYDFTFAHSKEGFDNHIQYSVRGYSDLLQDVISYSRYFIENNTDVVDIGCSTGKLIESLITENQDHCQTAHYVGVELAFSFENDLKNTYNRVKTSNPGTDLTFVNGDVREYDFKNCSLITSIFTLQFMPPRCRKTVLKRIYKGLNKGSAFIFAEKTVASDPRIQEMLTFNYYDYKKQNFSSDEILNKERTLRHMIKPNTWEEIVDNLVSAGWDLTRIQPFWRNHMFIGALAIK